MKKMGNPVSPHANLAMEALRAYVAEGKTIDPPSDPPPEFVDRAGVFVCIKKFGELRGCVGTIEPTQPTIAEEIIQNSVSAAVRDFRFLPVEAEELDCLTCSVDVLTSPEIVNDVSLLHPKRYGVIVESGMRRGLLLPDLDGVDTVEDQIDIARKKAMISPDDPVKLYRFEVKRFY
ncbi:MAG: AmmeMemoRadiSam system protein A [Armatimonadetes bacterium]|nr:AmmeMemoRadiSam system protein A [Armatimonadota bacterium]